MRTASLLGVLATLWAGVACATTVTFDSPTLDQWVYNNFSDPGGRDAASIFTAGPDQGVDDRFGMMLTAFQTSGSIPSGRGVSNYEITRVRLTLHVITGDGFHYDPTYDSLSSYLPGGVDFDVGRPVEVFGVGLRAPYTGFAANPGSAGSTLYHEFSPVSSSGVRNTQPLAIGTNGQLFNAANNLVNQQEAFPFAVGQADVEEGELVPTDAALVFTLDLNSPAVLAYVREALNSGFLGLMTSSLHFAEGPTGDVTYPRLYTKEGAIFAAEFAPKLEIEYQIVPEPRAAGIIIASIALFGAGRRLRQRIPLS